MTTIQPSVNILDSKDLFEPGYRDCTQNAYTINGYAYKKLSQATIIVDNKKTNYIEVFVFLHLLLLLLYKEKLHTITMI